MKRLAVALVVLGLAASAPAQTPPASPAASAAPKASDWKPGEPPPEMTTYYMVMLVKGPKWDPEAPDREQIQKEHLAHLRSLWAAGKTVVAGPFTDGGTIRGLVVYKVGSLEEARALASDDPAVKAGRLAVEAHPWMVQKGILP